MSVSLKPLHRQVIVVTGATSGIGLATVKLAVEQGARVFMIARNEDELQNIQDEMRRKKKDTAYAVADVGDLQQLIVAAEACVQTFGGIDTWINNAGVSIYGKLLDTTDEEGRRLFDTNFWGVVNGCKAAVPYLKASGGALINVGSVLSDLAFPIQGIYSASKHAVKGYSDALRTELLAEKAPISVTLVKPSAIDTPYTLHARSHIGEPTMRSPVYAPEVVAETILRCAVKPTREISVGATSFIAPLLDRFMPGIKDRMLARQFMEEGQSKNKSQHENAGSLFTPPHKEGDTRGNFEGHVMKSSLATKIAENKSPLLGGVAVLGGAALLIFRKLRMS